MKRAVLINGVAAEVSLSHFLPNFLMENGYQIGVVNLLEDKNRLEKIEIKVKPDLIIGFSLGGMVAMGVAGKYPKAKLILVATGVRFNPENLWFKLLLLVTKQRKLVEMMRKMIFIPEKLLIPIYEKVNPVPVRDDQVKMQYQRDMTGNIRFFRKVSLAKWLEIAEFCQKTDTTGVATEIKNETLIFSGEKDGLMAVSLGKEMNKLIKNSRLVVTKGGHFNVITKYNLEVIGSFL